MNFRDLKYLIAVYDMKNFSKAAEQCFVSQPTLSGQLKKMEAELGVTLIERSTRQVLFTEVGEDVVEAARNVLIGIEGIRDIATASKDPLSGDFSIGLIPTIGPFLLPLVMPALTQDFAKLNLFLHELQTDVLLDRLFKGELDVVILAKLNWDDAVKRSTHEIHLYSENLQLAVSDTDELAKINSAPKIEILNDRNVLMLEDGHCLRDQAMDVCFTAGAKEDMRFQATSMDTLLHMVASGAGITLVPELATNKKLNGINYLEFEAPIPHREVVLLTRKNSARLVAAEAIAKSITNVVTR